MKINHNIAALNAYRNLSTNNTNTAKNLEKLSSGLRINRAADDAAGLAISEKMRSQIRGLDMAQRNALDGISYIQTAEGALSSTHDILQRMNELAVQAANGTNTDTDRAAIQEEMNQMTNEINRIGNSTQFNTQNLLDGSKASVETTITAGKAATAATITGGVAAATTDLSGISADAKLSITIDSTTYNLNDLALKGATGAGKTITGLIGAMNTAIGANGTAVDDGTGKIKITSKTTGSSSNVSVAITGTTVSGIATAFGLSTQTKTGTAAVPGVYEFEFGTQDIKIDGTTLAYDTTGATGWNDAASLATSINGNATLGAKYSTNVVNGKIQLTQKAGQETASAPVNGSSVIFQIGANDGQSITINISDMRAASLGLTGKGAGYTVAKDVNNGIDSIGTESGLDVTSADHAASAITTIQNAINAVSAERSRMGAVQNRLEHTVNNLQYMSENVTASESRIRDVDMALEMTNYTKNNILVQSAQAMLAQANQLPQGVLQLLK